MNPVLLVAVLLFLGFLAFYAIWSFFLLYHLLRFAPHKGTAIVGSAVFLGVTVFLLFMFVVSFQSFAWDAPLTFPGARF